MPMAPTPRPPKTCAAGSKASTTTRWAATRCSLRTMRDALFRLLYQIVRALRPKRTDHHGPRTILVLQYAMPLGCCVHGTPIYAAIKQANPDITIIVATRGTGLATLQHDPHVDHLIDTPDPMASFAGLWKTVQTIRKQLRANGWQPDAVLQDASNRRGKYALFAMLREANPKGLPVTAFVMQGSGGQRTGWHDDRFVEVIQHMGGLGHMAVFLGTASDAPNIERIWGLSNFTGYSFAGQTSIPVLAALLCLSDLAITVDTGTMHVARAVDLPMIVLGPSWQKPLEWLPLGK